MTRVGVVYNLIKPDMLKSGPLDRIAEYDSEGTIAALSAALESAGHQVLRLEADEDIIEKLKTARPDLVFNIAEGLRGESRESHLPAICEMLGIPYTGSGVFTTAVCLDKVRTKEILGYRQICTPAYQVFGSSLDPLAAHLKFPLIVKLSHEGSSMGLTTRSVVDDETALRTQVDCLLQTYGEPVLVEEFIAGREFTVGVLGNQAPLVLPITEIVFSNPRGIVRFYPDEDVLPFIAEVKEICGAAADMSPQQERRSVCPAEIDEALRQRIEKLTLAVFYALGCRDLCRMEMRLGRDGALYILDVNPIAGIDPTYWLPRAAQECGLSYADLVNSILNHAMARQPAARGIPYQ